MQLSLCINNNLSITDDDHFGTLSFKFCPFQCVLPFCTLEGEANYTFISFALAFVCLSFLLYFSVTENSSCFVPAALLKSAQVHPVLVLVLFSVAQTLQNK